MNIRPKVLLITSDPAETEVLERILKDHVILRSGANLMELQALLEETKYDAVFCGWSFHRGTWYDAVDRILNHTPDLPIVIFCRTAGEREWVEVLKAGAFDLLVPPYGELAVLSVLEQAVSSYEVRRMMSLSASPRAS